MPSQPFILRSRVPEGHDIVSAFRITHADGAAVVPSTDVQTWDIRVYDVSEGDFSKRDVPIYEATGGLSSATNPNLPSTPAVFFDTLQTDGYWNNRDGKGYNMLHSVSVANLESLNFKDEGGKRLRLEYLIKLSVTASTQQIFAVHMVTRTAHESA